MREAGAEAIALAHTAVFAFLRQVAVVLHDGARWIGLLLAVADGELDDRARVALAVFGLLDLAAIFARQQAAQVHDLGRAHDDLAAFAVHRPAAVDRHAHGRRLVMIVIAAPALVFAPQLLLLGREFLALVFRVPAPVRASRASLRRVRSSRSTSRRRRSSSLSHSSRGGTGRDAEAADDAHAVEATRVQAELVQEVLLLGLQVGDRQAASVVELQPFEIGHGHADVGFLESRGHMTSLHGLRQAPRRGASASAARAPDRMVARPSRTLPPLPRTLGSKGVSIVSTPTLTSPPSSELPAAVHQPRDGVRGFLRLDELLHALAQRSGRA